jgi:hypothetical protein
MGLGGKIRLTLPRDFNSVSVTDVPKIPSWLVAGGIFRRQTDLE